MVAQLERHALGYDIVLQLGLRVEMILARFESERFGFTQSCRVCMVAWSVFVIVSTL